MSQNPLRSDPLLSGSLSGLIGVRAPRLTVELTFYVFKACSPTNFFFVSHTASRSVSKNEGCRKYSTFCARIIWTHIFFGLNQIPVAQSHLMVRSLFSLLIEVTTSPLSSRRVPDRGCGSRRVRLPAPHADSHQRRPAVSAQGGHGGAHARLLRQDGADALLGGVDGALHGAVVPRRRGARDAALLQVRAPCAALRCVVFVRVHPRCKNGSCEIIQRIFETFGQE